MAPPTPVAPLASRSGIWTCKIGVPSDPDGLPRGSDYPMRKAVERAYKEITGEDPQYIFSGWNGSLTEAEQAVVDG